MHSRNSMWVDGEEEEENPNPKTSSRLGGEEGQNKIHVYNTANERRSLDLSVRWYEHVCERFLNLHRWVGNVDANEMKKGRNGVVQMTCMCWLPSFFSSFSLLLWAERRR